MESRAKKQYRVSLWSVVVGVLVLALASASLVLGGLAQAQEGAIEYPENGEGAVATFTAGDPEGGSYQWMELSGTDAALFEFEDGVLSFMESPDFEDPKDVDGTSPSTAVADDNVYEVTVAAIDEDGNRETKTVMVKVLNEDEDGKVTLEEMPPPYPGQDLAATLSDDDVVTSGTEEWRWARSRSKSGPFADIEDADSSSYRPSEKDVGYYLRATVEYDDGEGDGKSAMDVTDHAVQPIRLPNTPPAFPVGSDARKVAEGGPGRNVGAPVAASDNDNDVLTYKLGDVTEGQTCADNDNACFTIDEATGQIKTKDVLNHTGDAGQSEPTAKDTYSVTVTATDSGRVSTTQTVAITVEPVDEPPAIAGAIGTGVTKGDGETYSLVEGFAADATVATFTASDPETSGGGTPTWAPLGGADRALFSFASGALSFRKAPDYEKPGDEDGDNVYEVTLVATDTNGNSGTQDVKVTVTNEDETGMVTLMPVSAVTQPRVGIALTASLEDPDGGAFGITWSWNGDGDVTNQATYTPVAADVGNTLTATATYADAEDVSNATKTAMASTTGTVALDTRNKAPVFTDEDEDTAGVQAKREVLESTVALATDDDTTDDAADNVGDPVSATDNESLTYTLSGPDAAMFRVRQDDPGGQIEVAGDTKLDFESGATYMVTVTAEDSFGVSSSIEVTIIPTDDNEPPVIMVGGLAISGLSRPSYAENDTGAVATYTVAGPNAASAAWVLSGADAGDFRITNSGALIFRASPNYEAPADNDGDNTYEVTVEADDGTYMDTHDVTVMVTNVDEDGTVTLAPSSPSVDVGITATLIDLDGNVTGETWQWARETSAGVYEDIPAATSSTYTPASGDVGKHLRVTVTYIDGHGPSKEAMETSDAAVTAGDPLMARYDTNPKDGCIQLDEARAAVGDYFTAPKGSLLSLEEAREVVGLHFECRNRQSQ